MIDETPCSIGEITVVTSEVVVTAKASRKARTIQIAKAHN